MTESRSEAGPESGKGKIRLRRKRQIASSRRASGNFSDTLCEKRIENSKFDQELDNASD